jgi:Asp-tRNA(Asn)/Glu-tRNA(Gln) amidotransferase A subunit family amidase
MDSLIASPEAGHSNTLEFGLGSHTFNEVFGVMRNANDPKRSAGGSGRAAVALVTRMLAVADGSDLMGSLRNPAAWNNVFGMRPSQGSVPMWPALDVWVSQLSDCNGVYAVAHSPTSCAAAGPITPGQHDSMRGRHGR